MEHNMEHLEKDIQKKLVGLCNILPSHLETWKTTLKESQGPVKALENFSEQLRCIEKADIRYMDNFSHVKQELQCQILDNIEEEIALTKIHIEKLNKANHDLKNKLSTLERATIDLNWDLDSPLLKGTPTQPPLNRILTMAYNFWSFFFNASKNINIRLKDLNVREQKSVDNFVKSFSLELENSNMDTHLKLYLLLALTQYVINEKAIT